MTRKLENYRGAGMNGSAPVDSALMTMRCQWSGRSGASQIRYLGALRRNRCGCRADSFCRPYQRDDTGETVAVEVVMRGRRKKSTPARANREKTPSRKSPGLHLFPADDGR